MRRPREPFFWALFSSGGMIAALVLPALALCLWVARPLGWISGPTGPELAALLAPPLLRLCLFVVIALALFHWAHRFRYTLYDGLQLSHLYGLIASSRRASRVNRRERKERRERRERRRPRRPQRPHRPHRRPRYWRGRGRRAAAPPCRRDPAV